MTLALMHMSDRKLDMTGLPSSLINDNASTGSGGAQDMGDFSAAQLAMLQSSHRRAQMQMASFQQAQQQQQRQQVHQLLLHQLQNATQQLSAGSFALSTPTASMNHHNTGAVHNQALREALGLSGASDLSFGSSSGIEKLLGLPQSLAMLHAASQLGKRKQRPRHDSDASSECSSTTGRLSMNNPQPPPVAELRVKGQLYLVKGNRKKWDGKRFARCCKVTSCDKLAQGTTEWCKNHGGGTRCSTAGCQRAARGGSEHCAAHGGGKRCTHEGCSKAAIGQLFCRKHGGGKQCKHEGCETSARGKTDFCVQHGGGVRCTVDGCSKSARTYSQGRTFCRKHQQLRVDSKPSAVAAMGSSPFAPHLLSMLPIAVGPRGLETAKNDLQQELQQLRSLPAFMQ